MSTPSNQVPADLAPIVADLVCDLAAGRGERIDLEADRDAYRLLAHVALGQIHDLTVKVRRQSDTIIRLHTLIRKYLETPGDGRERRAA